MSSYKGINPRTAAGISTLAAVVGTWRPTLKNQNLAKGLRETAAQMARMEAALTASRAEYESGQYTEDTQSQIAEALEGGGQ